MDVELLLKSLVVIGLLLVLLALSALVVSAFETSWFWGLLLLLVPPTNVFYIATHWEKSRKWVGLTIFGLCVIFLPVLVDLFADGIYFLREWDLYDPQWTSNPYDDL